MSKGFVLVEVSISYVILALAIMSLVPAFIMALRANKQTEKIQVAADLSTELMEEVLLRKWDENSSLTNPQYLSSSSTTLGPDAGETPTDKTTFDDIDDFNGWTETGAKDPMGNALSAFGGYNRTVTVSYTDSSYNVVASTSDYKKVTVCTSAYKLSGVCLDTVVTNH